jgi:hypothetical protein
MNAHEESIIRSFIAKERRPRWLESLASEKKRGRMVGKLNHCKDLDQRFLSDLPKGTDVAATLRAKGAPVSCYVISCSDEIDEQEMPLDDAIAKAADTGWGTIIGCIPGKLAYYYDELGERRMLLERP